MKIKDMAPFADVLSISEPESWGAGKENRRLSIGSHPVSFSLISYIKLLYDDNRIPYKFIKVKTRFYRVKPKAVTRNFAIWLRDSKFAGQ